MLVDGVGQWGRRLRLPVVVMVSVLMMPWVAGGASAKAPAGDGAQARCRVAVVEGQVAAGQGFEKAFTKGLKFGLEPLPSGWIIRVLATDEPRGAHDYAELATPPYQSVSPLLISTDWSFRAQDAVAWNPRRFQYARDKTAFGVLEALQPKVMAGDGPSAERAAALVAEQPVGTLEILDAKLAPGIADQAKMASTVASHLATTPHSVDQSASPSLLGKVEAMRFRVALELSMGSRAAAGVHEQPCAGQPTGGVAPASQHARIRSGR